MLDVVGDEDSKGDQDDEDEEGGDLEEDECASLCLPCCAWRVARCALLFSPVTNFILTGMSWRRFSRM
jgi:hypothetical protein